MGFRLKMGMVTLAMVSGSMAHAQSSATTVDTGAAESATSGAASVTGSSSASTGGSVQWMKENMVAGYTNWFFGPASNDPGNGLTPDRYGKENPTSPISMEHRATLGAKIDPNTTISMNYEARHKASREKSFEHKDPFVRVKRNKIAQKGGLTLDADLRVFYPGSKASHNTGRLGAVRSTQYFSYPVPTSRFSLLLTTFAKVAAYKAERRETDRSIELYAAPEVDYQITPTLKAAMIYELGADHMRSDPSHRGMKTFFTDLQPGLVWDITPNIVFNPYLNITTGARIAADTTTLNAIVEIALL